MKKKLLKLVFALKKGSKIMNKTPYTYNEKQFAQLEEFITENFGSQYDYLVHEITSEYVHTDTLIVKSATGQKQFITCGMGAREMNAPINFKRCELVMLTDNRFVATGEKAMILSSELVKISKFPFREDTWFGNGHTIDASNSFKETFGYDCFAFIKLPMSATLSGIDNQVNFLLVVPIYKQERDWCVNNNTLAFFEKLQETYANSELCADVQRNPLILDDLDPDEIDAYNLMTILGIDKPAFINLCEMLEQQEQNGVPITNELICELLKTIK